MSRARSRRHFLALSATTALGVTTGCVSTTADVVTFTVYNGLADAATIGVRIEHDESGRWCSTRR